MLKKINTKNLATLATIAAFALSSGGFASADFMAINQNTGFSSTNTVSSTGSSTFGQVSTNTEVLLNTAGGSSDTGNNVSDSNTGNGTALSGGFLGIGGFDNELNINIFDQTGSWWNGQFDAENNTTGATSNNNASATFTNSLDVDNTNDADVDNVITVVGNTGSNTASTNTGNGSSISGSAAVLSSQMTTANGNSMMFEANITNSIFDDMAKNMTTGSGSVNNGTTSLVNNLDFDGVNTMDVDNDSTTVLTTGSNQADSNTGDGTARSGNAAASQIIANNGNSNEMIVDISGAQNSSMLAINEITGAGSSNTASDTVSNTADITNTNDAIIDNDSVVVANTGSNTANMNTGNGWATSGTAGGSIFIDNGGDLNSNMTRLIFDGGVSTMTAVNKTTGSGSANSAMNSLTNNLTVDSDNDANVTNNATIVATSGNNQSNSNTGNGTTLSGNVSGSTDIVNELNINQTDIDLSSGSAMISTNDTTGANSSNTASSSASNMLNVSSTNNANLTNNSSTVLNSGGNTSSFNTGTGSSTSGSSTMNFGIINQSNGNITTIN